MAERRGVPRQHLERGTVSPLGSIPPQVPPGSLPARRRATPPKEGAASEAPGSGSAHELQGVYIISVAARLLEMHPQTLRKYERIGLVRPARTIGMLRLYSERDITRLRLIKHLVDDLRINLAGGEFAMRVLSRISQIGERLESLELGNDVRDALEADLRTMMELLDMDAAYAEHQRPLERGSR